MYTFVKTLSRRRKRAILLGVDMVFAPFSLFLAVCLQQNTLWPSALLVEFWTLFPLITILAGVISVSLGIPNIQLKTYETRAILKTGGFAALLALITAAMTIPAKQSLSLARAGRSDPNFAASFWPTGLPGSCCSSKANQRFIRLIWNLRP